MRNAALVVAAALWGIAGVCFGEEKGKLPFTVSKETTGIVSPLREDGTVDYVGALNERYGKGVTKENNGFVVWLKVVGTGEPFLSSKAKGDILRLCGAEESKGMWQSYEEYLRRVKGMGDEEALEKAMKDTWDTGSWKAADRADFAAYLKTQEEALAVAVEAAGKERWWSPYVGERMYELMLPALGRLKDAQIVLCERAMMRAAEGDWARCLEEIRAAFRLSRHVGGGAMLIERLVGISMGRSACMAVGVIAGGGRLSEAQCEELRKLLEVMGAAPGVKEAMDHGERWAMLDAVQVLADAAAGAAERTGFKGIDRKLVDWDVVLRRVNREMDKLVGALELPTRKLRREKSIELYRAFEGYAKAPEGLAVKAGDTRESYSQRMGEMVIGLTMPSLGNADDLERELKMMEEMALAVVGAGAFRAKHGAWPKDLKELVPGYLKEVPVDMYAEGKAVRYRVMEAGVRVYSVGRNGVDDGGEVPEWEGFPKVPRMDDNRRWVDDVVVGVR